MVVVVVIVMVVVVTTTATTTTTTTTTILQPFVWDYPSEPVVPYETFIHSPILVINLPLSAFFIYYNP